MIITLSNMSISSANVQTTFFAPEPDQRLHAAYHEAAHAVVAYYFGWWVNHECVEIDERQYCGLRRYTSDNTEQAQVCVNLAGWRAEMRLNPVRATARSEFDLIDSLCDARWDPEEDDDDIDTFRRLLQEHPHATDEDLFALYRFYGAMTDEILSRPNVWASIERVAHALLQHGKLGHEEVIDLLDDGVAGGAFRV
jgi:hypothetical protein